MSTSNDRSKDEAEVRNLIENWAKAIRSENLDGVIANHSQEILMFDLASPSQLTGMEAYEKSWPQLFTWFKGSGSFDLSELNITTGNDVAFATALIHCSGTEANGEKAELEVRLTVGLRKIDGRWTVMHEHHSEPSR